jgi:hypothetical protein
MTRSLCARWPALLVRVGGRSGKAPGDLAVELALRPTPRRRRKPSAKPWRASSPRNSRRRANSRHAWRSCASAGRRSSCNSVAPPYRLGAPGQNRRGHGQQWQIHDAQPRRESSPRGRPWGPRWRSWPDGKTFTTWSQTRSAARDDARRRHADPGRWLGPTRWPLGHGRRGLNIGGGGTLGSAAFARRSFAGRTATALGAAAPPTPPPRKHWPIQHTLRAAVRGHRFVISCLSERLGPKCPQIN